MIGPSTPVPPPVPPPGPEGSGSGSAAGAPTSAEATAGGVRAARLGELDGGVVAVATRGGVAEFDGGTRLSWWIGAEDRWHRPSVESSTRDRLVDGSPVVESSVRIPSGDAVGRVTVGRADGVPRPSVLVDVENASPLPVAFAYVVESDRPMSVTDRGVVVDGVGALTLTRPALGYAVAADADALVAVLTDGAMTSDRPTTPQSGAVAVLVPLPHTAHAVATFTPGLGAGDDDVVALADREAVPGPDRVVTGWATHTGSGPRLDLADARHRLTFAAAVADVLLGVADGADPAALGLTVEALGRTGRVDDLDPLLDLLDRQRTNGSIGGDEPVASTLQFVRSVAAWWAGGADRDAVEPLLGPLAVAAGWLDKRKQRSALAADPMRAARALRTVVGVFADLDQPAVAAAVLDHVARLDAAATAATSSPETTAPALLAELGDGLAWDDGTGRPDPAASARFVVRTLDEVVRDTGDAFDLLGGWSPSQAGEQFEAHDVPTRAGLLSFGLRWHGERPALLWELAPWPGRPIPTDLRLTAAAIDPAWAATQPVGEALLALPAGVTVPEPVEPPGSVSVDPLLPPDEVAPPTGGTETVEPRDPAAGGSFS